MINRIVSYLINFVQETFWGAFFVKRLDLKLGYSCNNSCLFCAVGEKRKLLPDKSEKELRRDLEAGRKNKADEVVFTGGEPTLRKELVGLVKHAKDLGYKAILVQSNGRRFSDKGVCKRLVKAGVTEFCPSLHGPTAGIHDFLTTKQGSFGQTLQGIKNLVLLEQHVVTNSVITKQNFRLLPELTGLLVSLKVNYSQLAFVHPMGNAWKNFEKVVPSYEEAMPFVYKSIEIAKQARLPFMIEAAPYCVMQGYERFVSETFIPETEIREPANVIHNFSRVRKEEAKAKSKKCSACRYNLVCEGPWKEYPAKKGFSGFEPVPGKKIKSLKEMQC